MIADDLIENWAREAFKGRRAVDAWFDECLPHFRHLAVLAMAHRAEMDAAICDRLTHALDHSGVSYHRPATADRCAAAIRASVKEQG